MDKVYLELIKWNEVAKKGKAQSNHMSYIDMHVYIFKNALYFFKEKGGRSNWKTMDDMLDSHEAGNKSAIYLPQTFWLCENNAKFDHIFKFEDLLLSQKNIRAMWPQFTCRDPLIRSGRLNGYQGSLTNKQIERIKKVYKDDIEFLSSYYRHLK